MAKYQKYAEYKDSGVEWLGEIPSHWATCSLSKLFAIKAGGDVDLKNFSEDRSEEYPYPIYTNANNENSIYGYSKVANYQANSITVSGRGEVGFSVYRDHPFDAIIRLLVLTPQKECHPKFYAYYINEVINFRVESSAIGQLSTLQISPYKTVLPAIDEQKLIISFLDYETSKIDTLIAKQEKLIELLKEKRQAVISHAVTKGLKSNVPMKDSGVEWLGDVPEHWKVSKLKHFVNVVDCKHITAEFFDEGIPLVSISEVKGWKVNLAKAKLTNEKYYQELIDGNRKPQIGDIIYTRNATVGEAAIVHEELPKFALGQDVCLIHVVQKLSPEFLLHFLKSEIIKIQLNSAMVGSTFKRINVDDIRNYVVVIPPIEDQQSILNDLNKKIEKYDSLISLADSQIKFMQERRTALISAVVTGKIDVRHWQRPNQNNNQDNMELST